MTWRPPIRRRPAFVRGALAAMLVPFAGYVGSRTDCNDRIPGLVLLPAYGLLLSVALFSFGWAVVAGLRRDRARAFAEVCVGLLALLAIVVAEAGFATILSKHCE